MNFIEAYKNAECYDEYIENLKYEGEIDLEEAQTFYEELNYKYTN
jgi:hypothetical protein